MSVCVMLVLGHVKDPMKAVQGGLISKVESLIIDSESWLPEEARKGTAVPEEYFK